MTLDDLKRLVTAEGVKSALEPQLFMSLTGDIDTTHTPTPLSKNNFGYDEFDDYVMHPPQSQEFPNILLTACSNAATWAYITLLQAEKLDDSYSDDQLAVMTTALVKRAIYELGRISLFDVSFHASKKDAQTLLNTIIGLTPSQDGQASSHFTGASITKDEKTKSQNLNPLFKFSQRQW